MEFPAGVVGILESLGRKKLALLSKWIFNHLAAPSEAPLFSNEERFKLVASFGLSSLQEVDDVVNSVDSFWREAVERRIADADLLEALQSMKFDEETCFTMVQIWNELGSVVLQKPALRKLPSQPVAVPDHVPDLLDVDYSVGIVVASKNADDSLPKPVMQIDLTTSGGSLNIELDFDQLAALHYALRDAQTRLDSS
ncbi:hypothetical protein L596_027805 [Steinernema carpocapsae]|uniref:COMM domain-containing protein n=1 Tax=Steinernema carpocapsae TaxID=34508 RepID=A0A4U5LWK0_STECR|nr:hypothetical protein L596_027805 [Steinernema carpocapsae]